jgi:hypothetical protein
LIVAQGNTTREAAAALFLSPKTVEFHLGNTYRKLGVRSRAELRTPSRGPQLAHKTTPAYAGATINRSETVSISSPSTRNR